MKKKIALIIVCFLLVMVPIRGYAAGSVVFGIGEEIIFPFLLSLLGVQAKETIGTYQDLKEYNNTIKGSLVESLAGLAGMEQVQEWLFRVVNGTIDTDSIVWQKLYEIAVSNYVVSSGSIEATNPSEIISGTYPFSFYNVSSGSLSASYMSGSANGSRAISIEKPSANGVNGEIRLVVCDSVANSTLNESYTYNEKTVYLKYFTAYDSLSRLSVSPAAVTNDNVFSALSNSTLRAKYAWLAVYGDYSAPSENIASYSDAFDSVLTSSDKEDIIDGTNVIQLYNPAELQNGIEIIPGGDPQDDPNLKKIPFAVTADWWNFLQQFGSGDNSNQYVNAYNALNGLDQGTSTGRISDAWDSLGIASVGASAAQAAEGILSLTDSNIYPQSQSVADTITNSIPSNLTPETPDSGIDNDSPQGLYKLPDLRDYFPFCIPFDLINLLSIFVAEPETPEFVIALSTGWSYAEENVSLEQWNGIANMVRNIELAVFVLGLILITRNIIRG